MQFTLLLHLSSMTTLSKEEKDGLLAKYVASLTGRCKCILQPSDHLRYLNASKWDVQKALDVTIAREKWYFETPIGEATPRRILAAIEDKHEHIYQAPKTLCPISHMGEDRVGRPVYWEKTGLISGVFSELIKVLTLDDMVERHVRNSVIIWQLNTDYAIVGADSLSLISRIKETQHCDC